MNPPAGTLLPGDDITDGEEGSKYRYDMHI